MTMKKFILPTLLTATLFSADETPKPFNTQKLTTQLLKPAAALAAISVPKGFRVQLAASEPMVRQPIDMAWDARGRLWIAECYTYAERETNFDKKLKDRIIILEDTNHDGVFDKRKIFWDGASQLTSIEIGFGGVWAACAPEILFLADKNGDDKPDGKPMPVLDGFANDKVRHNIVNGLRWGPDGWLYGRHGIMDTSQVGAPGTPADQRTPLNCGIWRYHPTRKKFEVVCHGTTNSWGHDWDEHGQLFFINTVIGHLWHVIPGARYERMYGEHFDTHLYELIPQTADHFHWDQGNEKWHDLKKTGMTSITDAAGGGHAHCGMMIYLGDNWPASYRNNVFTLNLHGRRINRDTLHRRGAGYTAKHAADHLKSKDPWFRGIELSAGPDGGVFVIDWSDIGECHDNDGIHRASGRIYKVTHGKTRPYNLNLANLSSLELAKLQNSRNEWLVRQSRQLLQARAATDRRDIAEAREFLLNTYKLTTSTPIALRAMWVLHVTGGSEEKWLLEQTHDEREHIRVWAIKLLNDGGTPSPAALKRFVKMAQTDPAGLVQLELASTLQRLPHKDRWPLATALVSQNKFTKDPVLPLMIWYGINPAIPENRSEALKLIPKCKFPKIRQFIARRLAGETGKPEPKK